MAKIECVSYIRVSGESQADKGGPDRQRKVIAAWAKRAKATVLREYADLGVSGTVQGDDRPGTLALFTDLAAAGGKPPVVVIERADRLARDLIAGELILQRLRELGVTVIIAETGQPLNGDDTPTGKLVRQILGAVSEFDKSSIVSKLKQARIAKRATTGRCEGRKPYGYHPGEQAGLTMLLECREKGMSPGATAKCLNAAGIPPRGSAKGEVKLWGRSSVSRIWEVHSRRKSAVTSRA
jgi:DNA invertase Pin-like site-specific DNA recombinase